MNRSADRQPLIAALELHVELANGRRIIERLARLDIREVRREDVPGGRRRIVLDVTGDELTLDQRGARRRE